MPEGTTPTQPQAGDGQQPQAGTPANPQAGAANPTSSQSQPTSGDGADQALTLEEAKKLRQEHAALRKRLKEYDDAKAQADAANMTDLQRLQKQHETVAKQAEAYRATIAQMTVQLEAQKLGIVDPEVAATLIAGKLEYGDNGAPTNAADLLKELVKNKPYLVAAQVGTQTAPTTPPATAGGATNPSRTSTNGGAKIPLSWDYIAQLQQNPTEYMARQAEIQQWMVSNIRSRPRR